jgi:hypothetical protein
LYSVIKVFADPANKQIFADKSVELMAVHCQMALARIFPHVTLVDRNADQMRHQIRQAMIVVAFHPDHFHMPLGIGKLADIGQKFPVVAGEAAEVKVGENISQQNEPAKTVRLQNVERFLSAAHFGA